MKKVNFSQKGFTLAEIIVVFGVVAMIFGLAISSTLKAQQSTSLQSVSALLVSDIKQQQVNSMTGFTLGGETASNYGIYFQEDRYTLFKGDVFNPADTNNFLVKLPNNVQFADIKFPNSILLLLKGSGEVSGYVPGSNSVSLKTNLSSIETFTVNKYGTVTGAN